MSFCHALVNFLESTYSYSRSLVHHYSIIKWKCNLITMKDDHSSCIFKSYSFLGWSIGPNQQNENKSSIWSLCFSLICMSPIFHSFISFGSLVNIDSCWVVMQTDSHCATKEKDINWLTRRRLHLWYYTSASLKTRLRAIGTGEIDFPPSIWACHESHIFSISCSKTYSKGIFMTQS